MNSLGRFPPQRIVLFASAHMFTWEIFHPSVKNKKREMQLLFGGVPYGPPLRNQTPIHPLKKSYFPE